MPRKPIRAPFVVTAAVMAAACGAQVSSTPTPTDDTGVTREDTELGQDVDLPVETTCPKSQPAIGEACHHATTLYCEYGACGAGSYPVGYKCDGSTWQRTGPMTSCNPPPVCPAVPYEGAPCTPGFGPCAYPDLCEARPADAPSMQAWGCSGKLEAPTSTYALKCPATAPKNGDPCNCAGHYPAACSYGDCYGKPTINARCDEKTRTWSVGEATCNPPPPDAGL